MRPLTSLINEAVPFSELHATVRQRAGHLASIPSSQLAAMNLIVNQADENMGCDDSQAPLEDQPDPGTVIEV